ncbi:probable LRR receptor-like serine/threonine-protein kinase RKF3 [Arachis duranensis]|uniref:non-specific serine/threonine protein kinase n=1 Tax=Arachis duranensis TaxID=130453 RepID=A0A6P4DJM7_ARADU|nr:probable LRR receptor-like serine/threonine-protein kinase RKF3 [Arachis duranensis]
MTMIYYSNHRPTYSLSFLLLGKLSNTYQAPPMSLFIFLFFLFLLPPPSLSQNDNVTCPLNTTLLTTLGGGSEPSFDSSSTCHNVLQTLHLLQADYLRRQSRFVPPLNSSASCWSTFQSYITKYEPNFDVRSRCGLQTSWISYGCMNITTLQQFESVVPAATIQSVKSSCNQSLDNNAPCASCTTSLSNLQSYLNGSTVGNVSDCRSYTSIYAAYLADPTDTGTAKCLFGLDFSSSGKSNNGKKVLIGVVVAVFFVLGLVLFGGFCGYLRWKKKRNEITKKGGVGMDQIGLSSSGLDSMNQSTTLIRFSFDEIKRATRNFSRDNIIGSGGYGNVYKGLLNDGSQVAMKRFKNCSVAGDASFTHEVEVIASVRHVNLVALRGYCTATTNLEGHQRIIVTDLMENGSLYDHLFGSRGKKLSWPLRQKIALGTARGLAYLHYGAQPSIIHRDIKASNILLDEKFEAKVADFGLAKFNPEGMTHMSTRVAGTMGYVAPEYALYGQLTERSDVFSYGVVLLELLSGRKALETDSDGQPNALTDLAWSLVREGKSLDVIEDGMPEQGAPEVLEKYVLVAVLCSHPQLYARPTMDQVVKMLETDESVPSVMERPIPFTAGRIDIEKSALSNSGQLCSPTGYQAFTMQSKHLSDPNKQEELKEGEEGNSESGTMSVD